MKYKSKPHFVEAMCFDGTLSNFLLIEEWCSEHDVENCETSVQGESEPLALDVYTAYGLRTLEAGDYVYILHGGLYAEKKKDFERHYEPA